jgi:uncharacterized membrane protein YccC
MTAPWSPLRALAAFDPNGWSLARGIRGALGCCVPLFAAQWYGNPALSWAALIGFWVALVDPGWPPRSRLLTIGGFIAASAIGCVVAVLLRPYLWPSGAFALVWCFAAILTRVWGDTAGSAGNLTALATLIVLGADQPSSTAAAAEMAASTVGGGLWGDCFWRSASVVGVPRRRCAPQLRQCSKQKPRSREIWRAPDRHNSAAVRCGKRSRTPASCWLPPAAAGSAPIPPRNASRYC